MAKHLDKHLIGLSGEYFVAGMLNMKGWVASLTLKNYPSVDIFALNTYTDETKAIQVKTTKNKKDFNIGITHDQIGLIEQRIKSNFVFVHISLKEEVDYYIVPRQELITLIKKRDDEYYNKQRSKPLKNYPISVWIKDLGNYKDKWDNIWK